MHHKLADWCVIHLIGDGEAPPLRVGRATPELAEACAALVRFVPEPQLARSFAAGAPQLVVDVTPEVLAASARGPEHRRLLEALAPTSWVNLPLVSRNQALGAMAVGSSRACRHYGERDKRTFVELGRLVALALDGARLHAALDQAVHARDRVLGVVAHDLRSPLAAISLLAQTMRRRPQAQVDPVAIDAICRATTRMNRLIQDLLDVAHLDAAQPLSVKREVTPAAELVTETADQALAWLGTSGRSLQIEVAPDLPQVLADRARFGQVVDNLLNNAVKFSPADSRIVLGARALGGEIVFSVSNEGRGIPADVVPHVFDRFWQGDASDRRGAGLGLSIAKEIVGALGGRIWVEPGPPVTTFLFSLPRPDQTA